MTAYDKLKEACEDYLGYLGDDNSDGDEDENYENDIFEKAMKFCCGDKVFDEVDRLLKERDDRQ